MKILLTTLMLISSLFAEIKVGDTFPKLTLVDQFDEKTEVKQKGTTILLLSFEKDVSSGVKKYLKLKQKGFLEAHNMMYISDISSMPSFITSWVAIPKMKKFSFKVSLIYDEKEAAAIPRKKGKVSVISLKNSGIKKIEFIEPKDLDRAL